MAAPSISPTATDEPAEPAVAVRTTRSTVKKVSQTQARNAKCSKKAKETDVSLMAHTSTVSSDEVSDSPLLVSFSCTPYLTHSFPQALMKKFVALGTECAEYLKVVKASKGTISISSHCSSSVPCVFAIHLTSFRLLS
jgi:hypothetical protein